MFRPLTTIVAALLCATQALAYTYTLVGDGGCRGNGGSSDKVESKNIYERTAEVCKQDCDNEPTCVGYAYNPAANSGDCLIYGPGMSGTCSDSAGNDFPNACTALGSCSISDKTTEDTCGTCSQSTEDSKATCKTVGGTWTDATWTSQGATWNGPDDPWTGDHHHTTHIHSSTGTAGYSCYDIDIYDHQAQCNGTATDSSVNCETNFTQADTFDAADCQPGCTYTAAPEMQGPPRVPHDPSIVLPGWDIAMTGACRHESGEKVNGKYSKTAGANGGSDAPRMTQEECAQACEDEPNCIAYAHGAWCVVYGPEIDLTPCSGLHAVAPHYDVASDTCNWGSDTHEKTTVQTNNGNIAYICVKKCEAGKTGKDCKDSIHQHQSGSSSLSQKFILPLIAIVLTVM